jgi:hypothetical protein
MAKETTILAEAEAKTNWSGGSELGLTSDWGGGDFKNVMAAWKI